MTTESDPHRAMADAMETAAINAGLLEQSRTRRQSFQTTEQATAAARREAIAAAIFHGVFPNRFWMSAPPETQAAFLLHADLAVAQAKLLHGGR